MSVVKFPPVSIDKILNSACNLPTFGCTFSLQIVLLIDTILTLIDEYLEISWYLRGLLYPHNLLNVEAYSFCLIP